MDANFIEAALILDALNELALSISLSDVFSLIALFLSVYAIYKTSQFNKRQESLIESQEQLNRKYLEKEELESIEKKKAYLRARLVKIGSNRRLKISNRGKAVAKNVRIGLPDDKNFVTAKIDSMFPLESLEPDDNIELTTANCLFEKTKYMIQLFWEDEFSSANEKTIYLTR